MADIMEVLQRDLTPRQRNLERIYSRKSIEQAFLETFEIVGGVTRLATWANDDANYKDFLRLLMMLAPKDVVAEKVGNVIEYRSNIPQSPLNRPEEIVIEPSDT